MPNMLEPHDHTPASAQAEFYPELQPEQIALYEILVTLSVTWHSEVDTHYLWLPRDEAERTKILSAEFAEPHYKIISVEEEFDHA
jgi:hypothetical protein